MKNIYKILLLIFLAGGLSAGVMAKTSNDDIISDEIFIMYNLNPDSYEIEILANPLKTDLQQAEKIEIRPLTQKEPQGLFTVLVEVIKDGKKAETAQVRMNISRFAKVLVVMDNIERFDSFSDKTVGVARVDITNLREQALYDFAETAGYRSKRNLRKGYILTRSAMEPIPDIESGSETKIVYDDGLCRITAPGRAMQSGMVGEYIKVRNQSTKKILMAKVTDANSVKVDP